MNAFYKKQANIVILYLYDYPAFRLADAIDKLAISGRRISGPSDRDPKADWIWHYEEEIWPAIARLLHKHECTLDERIYG